MLGAENDFGGEKHDYPKVKQEVNSKLISLTLTRGCRPATAHILSDFRA